MAKVYAVAVGRKCPAITKTWASCEALVKGFPGAKYKAFRTEEDARNWLGVNPVEPDHKLYAYVDGSFVDGAAYAAYVIVRDDCVIAAERSEVTKIDAASNGRNIVAELSAAMRAVAWAKKNNAKVVIVHDYNGIAEFAIGSWQGNKEASIAYSNYMKANAQYVLGFKRVNGHSGVRFNELADQLAGGKIKPEDIIGK